MNARYILELDLAVVCVLCGCVFGGVFLFLVYPFYFYFLDETNLFDWYFYNMY